MHRLRLLILPLLLLLAACAGGSYIMVLTAAGGKKVQVPLGPGGPQETENSEIRISLATFSIPPGKKEMLFLFAVLFKKGIPPKRVQVDDVSEDPVTPLVDDKSPKLESDHIWRAIHPFVPKSEDEVPWLNYEGTTMRIYRFTITFADGHTEKFYQATPMPAFVKDYVKERLGFVKPTAPASN